tara:strand:+ start:463 stop:909 length:447 start_codon:yes stop_codon:yes gene_type:complete
MAQNLKAIQGTLTPIKDRVLVTDMDFGDQKTAGGIIIAADDGNVRGVYPRWGKVFAKGPDNKDEFKVGQWILVEHGRWTRGMKMQENEDSEEYTIRMVDAECILGYADEKPNDVRYSESSSGDWNPDTIDPGSFVGTAMNAKAESKIY